VLLVLAAACSSQDPLTSPNPSLPVGLTVNGQAGGTIFCGGGARFVTTLGNLTSRSVQVQGLTFDLTSFSDCHSHSVTLGATAEVPAGRTAVVRNVDLGGEVCDQPDAHPGCIWSVRARVDTDAGPAIGEAAFSTSREDAPTCGSDAPRLVAPLDGSTVSGIVSIRVVSAQPSAPCPSPHTFISALPISGGPQAFSAFLEGEEYRWHTYKSDNGEYVISAQKACGICVACPCGGVAEPVRIRVTN
jgi:hypothetical protein